MLPHRLQGILHSVKQGAGYLEKYGTELVDGAGLVFFRILYGLLLTIGASRFLSSGYFEKLYVEPTFFFRYTGFAWVPIPSPDVIHTIYIGFIVLGILISTGVYYRLAIITATCLFIWVRLIDVTNYLNHDYLFILLGILLSIVPMPAVAAGRGIASHHKTLFSIFHKNPQRTTLLVPRWVYGILQFQVACVYVFAAVAKMGEDWLLHGLPLGVWLPAKDELPLIGPLLSTSWGPLLFSWAGFAYDTTIVPLLLYKRTRVLAYILVVVFHGLTRTLFEIGMFPWIMLISTTLFFAGDWPRIFSQQQAKQAKQDEKPAQATNPIQNPIQKYWPILTTCWVIFHVCMPLRCFLIELVENVAFCDTQTTKKPPHNVLWDETGMRFSWRVMVREKSGSVVYRVVVRDGTKTETSKKERTIVVSPHRYLTWRQVNEMSGQPDLIWQLAQRIKQDYTQKYTQKHIEKHTEKADTDIQISVYVDAKVSLNGRPATLFIDPTIDLGNVPISDTGIWRRPAWVLYESP